MMRYLSIGIGLAALVSLLVWCATGRGFWVAVQQDELTRIYEFRGFVLMGLHIAAVVQAFIFGGAKK